MKTPCYVLSFLHFYTFFSFFLSKCDLIERQNGRDIGRSSTTGSCFKWLGQLGWGQALNPYLPHGAQTHVSGPCVVVFPGSWIGSGASRTQGTTTWDSMVAYPMVPQHQLLLILHCLTLANCRKGTGQPGYPGNNLKQPSQKHGHIPGMDTRLEQAWLHLHWPSYAVHLSLTSIN